MAQCQYRNQLATSSLDAMGLLILGTMWENAPELCREENFVSVDLNDAVNNDYTFAYHREIVAALYVGLPLAQQLELIEPDLRKECQDAINRYKGKIVAGTVRAQFVETQLDDRYLDLILSYFTATKEPSCPQTQNP